MVPVRGVIRSDVPFPPPRFLLFCSYSSVQELPKPEGMHLASSLLCVPKASLYTDAEEADRPPGWYPHAHTYWTLADETWWQEVSFVTHDVSGSD